ncbi:MAG: hypothetical protein CUN55_03995 [Phototrophicales bacterium]|nr:MAG: hypothetical protein CUN55_03995 [Phototrophicales bacterium]
MLKRAALLMMLLLLWGSAHASAQDFVYPADILFLMPNTAGIDQLWRIDAQTGKLHQLTNSEQSVLAYDAIDEQIVYIAGDTLFADEQMIATLSLASSFAPTVALSTDGRIAYSDDEGIWLYADKQSQLILAHPADGSAIYQQPQFVPTYPQILLLSATINDVQAVAVLNLETNALSTLLQGNVGSDDNELYFFSDYTLLDDGRVLLYSRSRIHRCNPCGIWIAPDLSRFTQAAPIFDSNLPLAFPLRDNGLDEFLISPVDIVQTSSNTIRAVISYSVINVTGEMRMMQVVADVDLISGTVHHIVDDQTQLFSLENARLAPNAELIVGTMHIGEAVPEGYGQLVIYEIGTGLYQTILSEIVHDVRWAN